MIGRRLILLVALLSAGVALVWLFGVRDGESLLSGAKRAAPAANPDFDVPVASAADHSDSPSTPPADRKSTGELALGNARIPVREALADDPDVRVLKYLILIDSSDGAVGRRVHAKGVRVEVYNKKPDKDSKLVAIISGNTAEMEFRDPPDPKSGFRDTVLLTMTLRAKNRIEYLDEAGGRIALLENEDLHLDDDTISGQGPARIEMQGMIATGTGLLFDRHTSGLTLERDVLIKGSNFALPSRRVTESTAEVAAETTVGEEEKTIACSGPFSFQPQAKPKAAENAPQDDLSTMMSGGVMTFLGNVVASQGDRMRLDCESLEIVLAEPTEPEKGAAKAAPPKLSVSRMFARGSSSSPSRLKHTMGTFIAETLLQEEKPDGTWVTLNGSPRIENAGLASAATVGDSKERGFDASASRQIRLRPLAPATADPPTDPSTNETRYFLVEIDGDASIAAKSQNPAEDLRVDAAKIDMHLSATPGADGVSTHGLDRLVARGNARGTLAKGVFKGEEITLVPSQNATTPGQYQLGIQPNPFVQFTVDSEDPKAAPQLTSFDTPNGTFAWVPSTGTTPAAGTFTGATTVKMLQGETQTLMLHATDSIEIALAEVEGKQAVSALDAKGNVTFEDRGNGANGSGRQMTLIPREDGSRRVRLLGSPAMATLKKEGKPPQDIAASSIEFDPSDGSLQARDSVNVKLAGLGLEPASPPPGQADTAPSRLRCQELDVSTNADGKTTISARRDILYDDPENETTARGSFLDFTDGQSDLVLRGDSNNKASMTLNFGTDANGSMNYVTITGPRLDLNPETKQLACPDSGEIELVRPLEENATSTKVRATSTGPIRYASNLLDLSSDVVIRFDENGAEIRALWCDRAKVFFADPEPDAPADSAPAAAGFKELIAEGRVHLEQSSPRPMQAEGHSLRWLVVEGRQTLFLSGTSPRCWIRGLSENEHLRYEADSFVVVMGSQDFTAENGRLLYEPGTVLK